jgi:GDP-L-fucose synthase
MNSEDLILVTGSGGVLGSAILDELIRLGYFNVLSPSSKELDLTKSDIVNEYFNRFKPKYVIHLASLVFGLKGNLNNQIDSLSVNTLINNNILMACREFSVEKIFFSGTVASYPYPYIELPLKEEHLLLGEPHWGEYGYAYSKRHALAYLNILKKNHNIDFCYGLFTNLYGPGDKFDVENGHVIPALIEKSFIAINSDEINLGVWGNKYTTRDFMFSYDAAKAAVLAMREFSGVINVSSGNEVSIDTVCTAINHYHKNKLNIQWDADAPIGVPKRSVDNTKLKMLGFKCDYDIFEGIGIVMSWYMNNPSNIRR